MKMLVAVPKEPSSSTFLRDSDELSLADTLLTERGDESS
jgi:hypothetical protein